MTKLSSANHKVKAKRMIPAADQVHATGDAALMGTIDTMPDDRADEQHRRAQISAQLAAMAEVEEARKRRVTHDTQDTHDTQRLSGLTDSHRSSGISKIPTGCAAHTLPSGKSLSSHLVAANRTSKDDWLEACRTQQPLARCIIQLIQAHQDETQLDGDNVWHSELFHFTFLARSHPTLRTIDDPNKAIDIIEAALAGVALRKFGCWERALGIDDDEARSEFADLWNRLRFVAGEDPIAQAIHRAKRRPVRIADDLVSRRGVRRSADRPSSGKDYEFFVGVAVYLQLVMGDQPIFLPLALMATTLGVSKPTISRYRRWMVEDDIARHVKAANRAKGEAAEYRVNVALWPGLDQQRQVGTKAAFDNLAEGPITMGAEA